MKLIVYLLWTMMDEFCNRARAYEFKGHDLGELLDAFGLALDDDPELDEEFKVLREFFEALVQFEYQLDGTNPVHHLQYVFLGEVRETTNRFLQALIDTGYSNYDELLKGLMKTEEYHSYFKAASMLTEIMWT